MNRLIFHTFSRLSLLWGAHRVFNRKINFSLRGPYQRSLRWHLISLMMPFFSPLDDRNREALEAVQWLSFNSLCRANDNFNSPAMRCELCGGLINASEINCG